MENELAYARKNQTRRALWEYDNIIRSLYLLDYVDSPPLRRNVQRALNRGENYHQLRRAVSYANFGKLRFKTEYEQQLWGECSRLLTNCIIYYNATILSNLLAHKERTGEVQGAALLKTCLSCRMAAYQPARTLRVQKVVESYQHQHACSGIGSNPDPS